MHDSLRIIRQEASSVAKASEFQRVQAASSTEPVSQAVSSRIVAEAALITKTTDPVVT